MAARGCLAHSLASSARNADKIVASYVFRDMLFSNAVIQSCRRHGSLIIGGLRRQCRHKSTYREAVIALNGLQSNAATIRKSLQHGNRSRKDNIPNMVNYFKRVGLSLPDLDKLSVIHVSGTKGKGSTCAFVESILRQYGYKTGFYSSPHLIEVRERISINGQPIDYDLFSESFWEVYNLLQETKDGGADSMPHYFSFLTVLAMHVFVQQKVDVAVVEVGIGGQYDSTNMIASPAVCGVSSLDLDHTNLLGHTLPDIAWHKAGIFKEGRPAVTVPQPQDALQVLQERAREIQCPLYVVEPLKPEAVFDSRGAQLGIAGHKQLYNAALAVALCRIWLQQHSAETAEPEQRESLAGLEDISPATLTADLPPQMITGLKECHWPGRTQTVQAPGVTYYLDGAHTSDSMQQCVQWFMESAEQERATLKKEVRRALLFNMTGDHRSVSTLLTKLKNCGFDMAAFCPNVVSTNSSRNMPDQLNLSVEMQAMNKNIQRHHQVWDDLTATSCRPLAYDPVEKRTPLSSHQLQAEGPRRHSQSRFMHRRHLMSANTTQSDERVSATFPCITAALRWLTRGVREDVDMETEDCDGGVGQDQCHLQVLVTGSLHLVGGVLQAIRPHANKGS